MTYWQERQAHAMGSGAHLIIGGGDDELAEWSLDELARLERCWSRFRPDSDLCSLNDAAGRWTAVSSTLLLAIERAEALWRATGGAFDPTVLDALERAGYDRTFELVSSSSEPVPFPAPAPGFGLLEIDYEAGAVRAPDGVTIDLSGIGKGLAADLVAEGLVERGAVSALVSVGGDIRTAGTPPEDGWRIPVEDPFVDGVTRFEHILHGGALVTSTRMIRRWHRAGVEQHHIIDPDTGAPADSGVAAVVAAGDEAWWAEGVAKAALVRGAASGGELLRRCGLTGWLFGADGDVVTVVPDDA
ncbi:MAG: thiamine biosynthesis lipoprotein ApbE [Acidimicrobiales bacterium]|nr:thiamine biosynthesis lipoprotein ApbE [Acidimicrobiales bacterium]